MSTAFATEAVHVQQTGHLSVADIARATGADETTVRAWLRGARSPSGARAERLAELSADVEGLARPVESADDAAGVGEPDPGLHGAQAPEHVRGGAAPAGAP